jgi:hypothetical protein
MDPVGFAMENFDAIGRWRTEELGVPIDASARLVDGTEIDGMVDLRNALLKYSDRFVQTTTEKLMTYVRSREAPRRTTIVSRASFWVLSRATGFRSAQQRKLRARPRSSPTVVDPIKERSIAMFITKRHLPRRTFLRGIGATVALPLLDAMVPAMAATPAPSSRYSFLHVPHGASPGYWRPTGSGKSWGLSRILQPIAPFKDRITVISGTDHRMATSLSPEESAGDHSRTAAVYLTAAHPKRTEGQDIYAGVSIDQVLASKIGELCPLPSLEMCIEDVGSLGVCGVGYSCAYTNSIAWSSPTSPLPMERNPQVVFERLFGDGGTPEERAARKREDRSILDSVLADMNRLQRGLGPSDLARFHDYLDDIREIERRIGLAEAAAVVDFARPETASLPFDEHV